MNQVILVGRLSKDVKFVEKDNKQIASSTVAIPKPYKNEDGIYETDFINFTTFGNVAGSLLEYCKKGDLIGIKGNLSSYKNNIQIVAEKVTFITPSKEKMLENDKIVKKI